VAELADALNSKSVVAGPTSHPLSAACERQRPAAAISDAHNVNTEPIASS